VSEFLTPAEMIELGVSRFAARFAGWVQARYGSMDGTDESESRLAEQWLTAPERVSSAVNELIAHGIWRREMSGDTRWLVFATAEERAAARRSVDDES